MTIIPFLMMWAGIFAILILFAVGIAIALNTQPKAIGTPKPPVQMQAKLRIVPVRPITDQVIDLKNVICNVRFPINR